ncbi:MAG: hypothetical protein AAF745_07845 [Planctomycetota bacterium]
MRQNDEKPRSCAADDDAGQWIGYIPALEEMKAAPGSAIPDTDHQDNPPQRNEPMALPPRVECAAKPLPRTGDPVILWWRRRNRHSRQWMYSVLRAQGIEPRPGAAHRMFGDLFQ